jgi:hypothetical protein
MKTTEMLSKIKALLNASVKLAQQTLDNGTVIEAESFEAGQSVFIVTDDERVALPIGEYKLEDGRSLIVEEEGVIASIGESEAPAEEPVAVEAEEEVIETEVPEEVAPEVEAIVEAVVEVVAPALEEVKEELKKLKKKFEDSYEKKEEEEEKKKEEKKEEMSKKFKHSPERKASKRQEIKFSQNRKETTLDRVLRQLNK